MDHWKKNLSARTDSFSVRLTSHDKQKEENGSLYEIDIESSVDFCDGEANGASGVTFEGFLTKPLPRFPKAKCENAFEMRQVEGNALEKMVKTQESKAEEKKPSQKPNTKLPTNLKPEKAAKVSFDKIGKENELPETETTKQFKEILKKHLIENFISKNDFSMKSILQNICNESENKQLHFHHHEHHHHYYLDDVSMSGAESQFYEATPPFERVSNHKKSDTKKSDTLKAEGKPLNAYYFNIPTKSTHTIVNTGGFLVRNREYNTRKNEELSEFEETLKTSSGTSRLKVATSVESVFFKKSDVITNHFYNDLESEKCDSYEMIGREFSEKEKSVMDGLYMKRENPVGEDSKNMSCDNSDKIQTTPPNTARKIQDHLNEVQSTNWGSNLKEELNEIKKELQRLEERHLMKRLKMQSGNPPKISVYSNKTYIIGTEPFCFKKIPKINNHLEKNDEPRFSVGFLETETPSVEKKEYSRKKFAPKQRRHLYLNEINLIPNKV